MIQKKILIFGYSGGIGRSLVNITNKNKYKLFCYNKKKINFLKKNSILKIHNVLKKVKADIIINTSGVLGNNSDKYEKIFDVNLMPTWEIFKFYKKHPPKKKIFIIVIGSKAYKQGRKNYILYASSKAALHNLCQGCVEYLNNININFKIFHFGKVNTNLIKNLIKNKNSNIVSPNFVAKKIYNYFDRKIA